MKFKIDHDLHIHSQLSSCSGHPEQTADAMLSYARLNGLRHICITDHFWDERVPGASDWYRPQNLSHISKALPLPVAEDVTFHFGCEAEMDKFFRVGLAPETVDKFDFIIIPTNHLHMDGFTIEKDNVGVSERAEYFMRRNHALLDMDLPFYKIGLAHFTNVCLYYDKNGTVYNVLDAISDSEYADFFSRAAALGIGIELNVTLEEAANPSAIRVYKIAKACGCKFYLGSDAHTPSSLANAMPRFQAIVDALDLTEDDKFAFA